MTRALESSPRAPASQRVVAAILSAAVLLGLWDLVTDSPRVARPAHLAVELAFVVLGAVAAVMLWRGWQEAETSLADARRSLAERQVERDAWRTRAQHALRGLGEAMDAQFATWALTPTEKETALFLLKGYSHKEVANLTGKSERTVRQHAVSVYRKSGLAGRAELAAFFFEDMLLPAPDSTSPPADPGLRA